MFRKILLPTDGSEAATRAAEMVASLISAADGVGVTLLVAIAPLSAERSDLDEGLIAQRNAQMRKSADEALKRAAQVFTDRGIVPSTKIIEGDPTSQAIADEVAGGGYDLVALGSRGMGMQKGDRRYIGSVTEHVVRRVDIPVLVLPVHAQD